MDHLPPAPSPYEHPTHSFTDRIVGSLKLSRPIFDEVRRDTNAMIQAAAIVVATSFLSGVGQFADVRGRSFEVDGRTYEVTDSVFGPLIAGIAVVILGLVFWIIGALAFRFVAIKFLGSSETDIQWQEVARPLGFASAPSLLLILTPIPLLGFLVGSIVGIWSFAAQIVAMSEVFRFTKLRSFALILISWIALSFLLAILFCLCAFALASVL